MPEIRVRCTNPRAFAKGRMRISAPKNMAQMRREHGGPPGLPAGAKIAGAPASHYDPLALDKELLSGAIASWSCVPWLSLMPFFLLRKVPDTSLCTALCMAMLPNVPGS